jgi:predicted RNA-binding Zn-ribbon protein involved in translation (DUF1610 family)
MSEGRRCGFCDTIMETKDGYIWVCPKCGRTIIERDPHESPDEKQRDKRYG